MKLLLDQGLPRSAVRLLNDARISAIHVSEIGMSTADDREILVFARQSNFIVVTLDADFHSLLAWAGATDPSVIRIRIEGLKAAELTRLLSNVVNQIGFDASVGLAVTVTARGIRIRQLPLP